MMSHTSAIQNQHISIRDAVDRYIERIRAGQTTPTEDMLFFAGVFSAAGAPREASIRYLIEQQLIILARPGDKENGE